MHPESNRGTAVLAGEYAHAPTRPQRIIRAVATAGALFLAFFHFYTSLAGTFPPLVQRGLFLGVGMALALLGAAGDAPARGALRQASKILLAILALYSGLYVVANQDRLMDVMNDLSLLDLVTAGLTVVLVLEASRRVVGATLPILAIVALVYFLFGSTFMSGQWAPPRVGLETALSALAAQATGVYGYLTDIGTRVIAVFVLYGSILIATGGGEVFMKIATLVAGRSYGGQAKVAVTSSALFGMVSGSAVANVMAVGTVTIPTMIRAGYPRAFAAGVEATASTGGQIMPPIMGAGAFIMAEWLDVSYAHVALAAVLPAILYFLAVFASVDAVARRQGLKPIPRNELPVWKEVVTSPAFLPTVGSMLVMIGFLGAGYSPTMAGAFAIVTLICTLLPIRLVLAARMRGMRGTVPELRLIATLVYRGFANGGSNLMVIAVLLGCAGLVVTVLGSSGVAVKFSSLMLSFSDTSIFGVLVFTALLCILLGMDVPTTASYVLAASVAVPALTALGLPMLVAHMFIFYFAILSAITPPVCASVYAAATLAQQDFWSVAGRALKIGGAIYFIPIMFVYRPSLLLIGSPLMIAYDFVITALAVWAMTGAMMGYLLGPLHGMSRALLFLASLILYYPSVWADGSGVGLLAVMALWQVRKGRKLMRAPA